MPDTSSPPARGRPRDVSKTAAILRAAREEFLRAGFEAASIEAMAARAGVAKATVYRQFGDKPALFAAMIEAEAAALIARIRDLPRLETSLAEQLTSFGLAVTTLVLAPEQIALERVLEQQAIHHPELARRFYEAGPARLQKELASILQLACSSDGLVIDDPSRAAGHLIALFLGFEAIRQRYLPDAGIDAAAQQEHLREAVDLFLRAYGQAGGAA